MWIKNLASLLLFAWLFCLFVRTSVESWFISTGAPLPSQRNLSEGKLMLQNFHISLIVHWDGSFLLSNDHFARLSGSLLYLGSLSLVPTLIPKRFSRRTINVRKPPRVHWSYIEMHASFRSSLRMIDLLVWWVFCWIWIYWSWHVLFKHLRAGVVVQNSLIF